MFLILPLSLGTSSWADYVNPKVRKWWSDQYQSDKYKGSTDVLHIWNDMNEPSVFNGPEITMPRDLKHLNGQVEHRDIHNLYGHWMHRATFEGLRKRNPKQRPFVLSRSFYAGSQRYGAIWTGDNATKWDQLAASVPMLLSLSLGGTPFVGADVGGFFGRPEPELLVRWYQTGALYPFFRAHAHIETKRREPWLLDEPYRSHIADAIKLRYQILPFIYTLAYESSITGHPMMRPTSFDHKDDKHRDDQFMLGTALLHKPVVKQQSETISVYLPKSKIWYDFFTLSRIQSTDFTSEVDLPVELSTSPLFLSGGSVVPLKMRQRRSSSAMLKDPFTLLVALNEQLEATGTVYVDQGDGYEHELGAMEYKRIIFKNGEITCEPVDGYFWGLKTLDKSLTRIESIVIVGYDSSNAPTKARVQMGKEVKVVKEANIEWDGLSILRLRMPPVSLSSNWSIKLS